ncbi:rCG28068 [Rattus norvegicus]|uniref:RCG28068 n=1 Tax=Rattus norvegicus TaxID=10116 RepID=A6IEJ1_RAT|nr:rCG28068 [Rattus norvegicus]
MEVIAQKRHHHLEKEQMWKMIISRFQNL